jgi:cytochrome c oxidase subunit 1
VFFANIITSYRKHRRSQEVVSGDPWDARGLEWMIPSPVPAHNYDEVPIVTHLDEFWHRKYGEDESGRPVRIAETADVVQKGDGVPHLPAPSYWPIVLAFALPLIGYGIIFNLGFAAVGVVVMFIAIYGWGLEPGFVDGGHGHDGDDHGGHDGPDGDGDAAATATPDDVPAESDAPAETEEAPVG